MEDPRPAAGIQRRRVQEERVVAFCLGLDGELVAELQPLDEAAGLLMRDRPCLLCQVQQHRLQGDRLRRGAGRQLDAVDQRVAAHERVDQRVRPVQRVVVRQPPRQAEPQALGSFGSVVALRLGCDDARVQKIIAIGAPARLHQLEQLSACTKPQLFIHGVLDDIAPIAPLEDLLAQLPSHEHLKFVSIAGAGHFFDDQLPELMQVIQDYVANIR